MPKIKVPGKRVEAIDKSLQLAPSVQAGRRTNGMEIDRIVAVEISNVRGATDSIEAEVPDDAVMVLHLENGFKLFSRHDDFRKDFPGAATRDAESGTLVIEPNLGLAGTDRTVGAVVLKALEIFNVKPDDNVALTLAAKFEKQLERDPGLYHLTLDQKFELSDAPVAPASGKPALVFIHGTASSSRGGYIGLSIETTPPTEFAKKIIERYGDQVFAFEHRTLTESPVTNALQLATALPENATLHLVSHSRGGLIGDLLCLGQMADASSGPDAGALQQLISALPEAAQINELQTMLRNKKVRIERFVRVASPSRGTTLASRRADRWLSILLDLIGHLPFLQDPFVATLYEALQDFVIAVVNKRMDPNVLPGLAAMMPSSPLVKLLNFPAGKTTADLSVIAGASAGQTIVQKLKLFPVDQFYGGQNDLIVNTASMDGGLTRMQPRRFLDEGSTVDHFSYFRNLSTQQLLLAGLLRADNDNAGFSPIDQKQVAPIPERGVSVATGPKPTLFLLPGMMGSNLAVIGTRVWLDYNGLFLGGLNNAISDPAPMQPQSVFEDFYRGLMDYLSATHEVIPFPYDWRVSMQLEAKRLAENVTKKLDEAERIGRPVRILAHSSGGLLARIMFAQNSAVWERLIQQPGGRFLMMGTPNGGSHEIVRLLTRQSRTIRQLELIDGRQKPEELAQLFASCTGLLELLPRQSDLNFFDPKLWAKWQKADPTLPAPPPDALSKAAITKKLLEDTPFDADHMLYVAGTAAQTPSELYVDDLDGNQIKFHGTKQGDGRVPWNTNPPNIPTYYSTSEHGNLANTPGDFAAIQELLQTGATNRLSKEPPTAAAASLEMPPDLVDMLPDEKALRASVLGVSLGQTRVRPQQRIAVSVTHGDLAFARYTVAVGHYDGDSIVGAEAQLDLHLNGALKRWNQLGVYPAKLGSSEVFLSPDPKDRRAGAIVVGLGRIGELKPKDLESTFYKAALKFALSVADCKDERFREADGSVDAKITSLLIGTLGGGVTVEDCVKAILRAVWLANSALVACGNATQVLIGQVEFLDLWEDRAIQAARAIEHAKADPDLRDVVESTDLINEREGALRRLVAADDDGWWNRLRISKNEATEALHFSVITNRARVEIDPVQEDRAAVDGFIKEAIRSSRSDNRLASTLFEMLVPNRLKEYAPALGRTVVMVDSESARYPWELMVDHLGRSSKPIAVESGFIRQLETDNYREVVVHGNEQTALVVGNPQTTKFPPLSAAKREAEQVKAVLTNKGVKVTGQPDPDWISIMIDLHAGPYRILHLAGHGVHEYQPLDADGKPIGKPVSGMVIGDNMFLTPDKIRQMRRVPELVFVNCCHLGRTDGTDQATLPNDRNRLAANLAAEFIQMGVKAVIAAGWAVDDQAASIFATRFYEYFLGGSPFGDAVLKARSDTFEANPNVNTWGAYQCYGDPDFKFHKDELQSSSYSDETKFNLPMQLLVEIQNLTRQAQVASGERIGQLREKVAKILAADPKNWKNLSDVSYALGSLYGELGDYDLAVECYQRAAKQEKALGSLKGVEQEVNLRVRAAVRKWSDDKLSKQACDEIDEAIKKIDSLLNLGVTKERLGLKASAYKRRAMVDDNQQSQRHSLHEMTKTYKEAYDFVGTSSEYSAPLTNWLSSVAVLSWADHATAHSVREHAAELKANLQLGIKQARVDPSFWNAVVEPDCLLVQYLTNANRADDDIKEIAGCYRQAKNQGASERQVQTVIEHLDFLIAMAKVFVTAGDLANSLDRCKQYILANKPEWKTQEPPKLSKRKGAGGKR